MNYQESFLNYLQYEKRYSSHTVTAYKRDLIQFVEFSTNMNGVFDVKAVDNKLVRSWVVSLMNEALSPRTIHRKVSTVKSFFKFLIKEKVLDVNPTEDIPLPKIRKKLPTFVEERDLHTLLDNDFFEIGFIGLRDKLIISLLYGTGIRLSELVNLTDNSFERKQLTIKVLGKRNKERIIPYPVEINNLLQEYIDNRNKIINLNSNKLLVTDRGDAVYEKLIYRVVKKYLGMVTSLEKKSPHILRHSYATHLLNKGADLNAVKELLGHANLAATQVYTHTTFEKLYKVYKQAHPRG